MKNILLKLSLVLVSGLGMSCEGFLDPKPDQSMVVPTSLEDVRSLLDNSVTFNRQPSLSIIAGDEMYAEPDAYAALTPIEQGAYRWDDDPFQGEPAGDWTVPYKQVFYSNVVLEALDDLVEKGSAEHGKLRGEALFHRAYAYYHILQQFAVAYQPSRDNSKLLGIVLRKGSDVNDKSKRSDLETSYQQVIDDLHEAVELLPSVQLPKTRPSKAAALGLLGRTYLQLGEYGLAAEYSAEALELYQERLDFNSIDVNVPNPFERFGKETVFYSQMISYSYFTSRLVFMDSLLIQSYGEGDLRRKAYFDESQPGFYNFTGKLTGSRIPFGGLAVGELQLIAAEGFARTGQEEKALQYLNALLVTRKLPGHYHPITLSGSPLLKEILLERRKELVGRGVRWSDLRRLNQDPMFATIIYKDIDGQILEILPESPNYVFPIPQEEIQRSHIIQNP